MIRWNPIANGRGGYITLRDLDTGSELFNYSFKEGETSITIPNEFYYGNPRTLTEDHKIQIMLEDWTVDYKYHYIGVKKVTVKNFIAKPLKVISPSNGAIIDSSNNKLIIDGPDMPFYYYIMITDNASPDHIYMNEISKFKYDMVGLKPGHNYSILVRAYTDRYQADDKPSLASDNSSFTVK